MVSKSCEPMESSTAEIIRERRCNLWLPLIFFSTENVSESCWFGGNSIRSRVSGHTRNSSNPWQLSCLGISLWVQYHYPFYGKMPSIHFVPLLKYNLRFKYTISNQFVLLLTQFSYGDAFWSAPWLSWNIVELVTTPHINLYITP